MKPVEEMNLEEALDAGLIGTTIKGIPHPDVPSFWPHDEVKPFPGIFLTVTTYHLDLGRVYGEIEEC